MKRELQNTTIVAINCVDSSLGVKALQYSMRGISFKRAILFSDVKPENLTDDIEFIHIDKLTYVGYSEFVLKRLNKFINTDFCLIVHDDGFIINPELWSDEFQNFDYIGAPWQWGIVGNGGFSLRSKFFLQTCEDYIGTVIPWTHENEDWHICYTHREFFNTKGCKFAPIEVAIKFSIESIIPGLNNDLNYSFGFHGRGDAVDIFKDQGQQFRDRINLLSTF